MHNLSITFLLLISASFAFSQGSELLKESINVYDQPANDYMRIELMPIRKEFGAITHKQDWHSYSETEISNSTEGGVIRMYKDEQGLRKLVVRNYGEMGQSLAEFYFTEGELIFVLERRMEYNRPLYYDEEMKFENEDTEAFDPALSMFFEDRNYFIDGELVHQIDNHDCGTAFDQKYLNEESTRIYSDLADALDMFDANQDHSDRSIIGVWQGIPVLASGWSDNYQFFEDGTFRYNHNQMDCADSVIYESGFYELQENYLMLEFHSSLVISGAVLIPSTGSCASEFALEGGEEKVQPIQRSEAMELRFVSPLLDFDYLERIKLDGSEWFRMLHDPNDY